MDYNTVLAGLQDVLTRADVLQQWQHSAVYSVAHGTRVEFQARIKVRTDAHAKPTGVEFGDAEIELELEYSDDDGLDSVRACSAQVVIDGLNAEANTVRFALHFDRHDPGQTSIDLHSRYHWQVGGERLEAQDFGTVLQLQGPRFPWHPIDPVLLVDFVLGHFHGQERKRILEVDDYIQYRQLLHKSQVRHVAPFFEAVQLALQTNPFEESAYWPSLCGPPLL